MFWVGGSEGSAWERVSLRADLLGQVGTDVDYIVSDHPQPDPASDAIRSFIERSSQPMPAFENTDAAFTACAPFLKLLEPTLLLPLFTGRALGVMARNRYAADPICSALDSLAAEKNPGSAATCCGARPNCSTCCSRHP